MKRILVAVLCVLLPLLSSCKKIDSVITENPLQNGGEYWELLCIDDQPIGYQRNVWNREEIAGTPVVRFEQESRMIVLRYGDQFDVAMKLNAVSNPKGELISVHSVLEGGGAPIETECRVEKDRLIVSSQKSQNNLPWQPGRQGPDAVIRNLLDKPMVPRENRNLTAFDPTQLRDMETKLHAEKIETISLKDGVKKNLLRISVENILKNRDQGNSSDQTIHGTLWTDASGNILRNEMKIGQTIIAYRVDKKTALSAVDRKPQVELGSLGVIALNRRISDAEKRPQTSFIVRIDAGSPSDRFPNTPFQQVDLLNRNTAKITVWSAMDSDPEKIGNEALSKVRNEAKPEDLASGILINLDDPELKKLANSVDSSSLSPWQSALALEKLVHETITQTGFSVAFASSSDVLQSRCGDCTEFAVLLAALCRSKGIPTRLTLGLVYSPFPNSFHDNNLLDSTKKEDGTLSNEQAEAGMVFHLWDEVLIDGVWRPLDATTGRGGADSARIKIADSALNEDAPALLVQSILGLIGRLEINIP